VRINEPACINEKSMKIRSEQDKPSETFRYGFQPGWDCTAMGSKNGVETYVFPEPFASVCTLTSSILELAHSCRLEVNVVEDQAFFCPILERLDDPDGKGR
jgi:hypothetical protein